MFSAHYAYVEGSNCDLLLNDPGILSAPNCLVLHVSATPYLLCTENSKIPDKNIYDIYKNNHGDLFSYFGIEQFVKTTTDQKVNEESGKNKDQYLKDGLPGTYTVDEDFEFFVRKKYYKQPESALFK